MIVRPQACSTLPRSGGFGCLKNRPTPGRTVAASGRRRPRPTTGSRSRSAAFPGLERARDPVVHGVGACSSSSPSSSSCSESASAWPWLLSGILVRAFVARRSAALALRFCSLFSRVSLRHFAQTVWPCAGSPPHLPHLAWTRSQGVTYRPVKKSSWNSDVFDSLGSGHVRPACRSFHELSETAYGQIRSIGGAPSRDASACASVVKVLVVIREFLIPARPCIAPRKSRTAGAPTVFLWRLLCQWT